MTAVVPDEAVLRTKVVWSWGLLLATASVAVIETAVRGRALVMWPAFLVAATVPGLLGLLWLLQPDDLVRSLAHDEVRRLLSLPLAVWAASSCLATPRSRRWFLAILIVSVIPVAGYALAQKLAGTLHLPVDPAARAAGTFGNPVFLGAYLVLVTPLCAAGALFSGGPVRWAGALATGLALPALIATESRGAWIGFATSAAVGILLLAPTPRMRRRLLLGLLVTGLVLAALSLRVLGRPQGHALIWRDTLAMVAARPWGVGPGQFDVAFLPFASPELLEVYPRSTTIINDAHCEPLQVLAELGWPGLAALAGAVALLAVAVRRSLATVARDDAERPALVAGAAALAGAMAQSFVSPDLRFMVSTLVLATITGWVASFSRPWLPRFPGGVVGGAGRAALAAAGLAGLFVAGQGIRSSVAVADLVRPRPASEPSPAGAARIADLMQLVRERPDDAALRYDLGVALVDQRHYAAAATSFAHALRLSGGAPAAIKGLGVAESLDGRFAEALPHLRAALASQPGDADLRYLLAYTAYGLGDIRTAILELETLLSRRPDHPQGRLLLEKLRE